jgi:hypothetical protein
LWGRLLRLWSEGDGFVLCLCFSFLCKRLSLRVCFCGDSGSWR